MKTRYTDEPILKMIGAVLRTNEKARGTRERFLTLERAELTECLNSRVNDLQTAAALTSSMVNATERAIFLWGNDESLSLGTALNIVWKGIVEAAPLLAPQNPKLK